jgi:hypothetical protein
MLRERQLSMIPYFYPKTNDNRVDAFACRSWVRHRGLVRLLDIRACSAVASGVVLLPLITGVLLPCSKSGAQGAWLTNNLLILETQCWPVPFLLFFASLL